MELNLKNSGALSREHYALVYKVENAVSPQAVDAALLDEISALKNRLAKGGLSSSRLAEVLILLEYCATAMTFCPPGVFDFAFPYAVQLAESGKTLRDRRISYQFCIQHIPSTHELNLMLVNTIRKDLESVEEPRIALALDYITQAPNADIIPAVQARLEALLYHRSRDIVRRTIFAIRALSRTHPSLPRSFAPRLLKKSKSSDLGVASSSLDLLVDFLQGNPEQNNPSYTEILELVFAQMHNAESSYQAQVALLHIIAKALSSHAIESSLNSVCEMLLSLLAKRTSDRPAGLSVLLEGFRTITKIPATIVLELWNNSSDKDNFRSPLEILRPLLFSQQANYQYAFLACLSELDPILWSGVSTPTQATVDSRYALSEAEVGRVMAFLESRDKSLRSLTYSIIYTVDSSVLTSYWTGIVESLPSLKTHSVLSVQQSTLRAFEVLEATHPKGDEYARAAKRVFQKIEDSEEDGWPPRKSRSENGSSTGKPTHGVLEPVVEMVLAHLHEASIEDRSLFVNEFLGLSDPQTDDDIARNPDTFDNSIPLINIPRPRGPSNLTILAAVAAEFGELAKASPEAVLELLTAHLTGSSRGVQEALLLSMLQTSARCTGPLQNVIHTVQKLREGSHRHIRFVEPSFSYLFAFRPKRSDMRLKISQRCDQFLRLTNDLVTLKQLAESAKSSSLPDFLVAIERDSKSYTPSPVRTPSLVTSPRTSNDGSLAHSSMSSSKLRYDAYEAPRPVTPLRKNRPRSDSHSTVRSTPRSPRSPYRSRRMSSNDDVEGDEEDPLSRTITAGELALNGGSQWLQTDSGTSPDRKVHPAPKHRLDSLVSERFDLIALDSPFRTEPQLSMTTTEENHPASSHDPSPRSDVFSESHGCEDFDSVWASIDDNNQSTARGWSALSPSSLMEKLEGSAAVSGWSVSRSMQPQSPFIEERISEIRAVVRSSNSSESAAALKLKPGEEGSCLWLFRCDNESLRERLRNIFQPQ